MANPINLISIAEDSISQQHGLKYLHHLPENTGMLFKFQSPRVLSFWMQDTYIPLDIAFIDNDGVIVKTERMVPLSTRSVTSGRPCIMALECAAGTFKDIVGKKITVDAENKRVTIND